MSRFVIAAATAAMLAGPALGADNPAPGLATKSPEAPAPAVPATPSLDELFGKLAAASDPRDGKPIEAQIVQAFERSGSDTADLLMSWATAAVAEKSYPQALDILDQVIVLQPDYAEAWNRRATVNYFLDDYDSSLADIRQTLALQPRHFGALSGLGMILEETGKKEQAIAVYRKALSIDPFLDKVKETLDRLEKEAERNAI